MTAKPHIQLLPDMHRQEAVVLLKFDYQSDLIAAIKTLPGVKWSQTKRCWYQPASQFDLHLAFNALKGVAYVDYSAVKNPPAAKTKNLTLKTVKYPHRATIDLPKGYLERLEQKRYSESTIRTYSTYMKDFLHHFRGRDINTIEVAEVNAYILGLIKEQNISASQQNQRINAIKFYYEKVIGREKQYYELFRPKESHHLPDVLSKTDIGKMINITKNLKHKSILMGLYSCGLRRSELINLKLYDIDSKRHVVKINAYSAESGHPFRELTDTFLEMNSGVKLKKISHPFSKFYA